MGSFRQPILAIGKMKGRINSDIKSHLIRSTSYTLLLALAVCVIPLALAQRNTTKTKPRQAEMGHAFPANTIVVTNTNDSGPGSLRDALAIATDGDTIDATGVSGTISLTSGELQITHAVTINGPGPESLFVTANGTSRVFDNLASGVTISGFDIYGGSAPGDNGGGILNEGGNSATLSLINCIVVANSADFGAGIFNLNGKVTVNKCTLNSNNALFSGGAIANSAVDGTATLIVTNSTLSFNFTDIKDGMDGAGIMNGAGGSALSVASVIVSNSTISGNSANKNGGGIANVADLPNFARVTINNSTFSDNEAGFNAKGNSIYNAGAAEFEIGGTILNLNQASQGKNIFNRGRATSLGYNLSNDDGSGILTGPGDQINTDPELFHLQDNGGPTFTQKPLPGSPAINAGDPNFTPPPSFDQRGPAFQRVSGGRIDIGSLEVQHR
jgi:hypothetical protein